MKAVRAFLIEIFYHLTTAMMKGAVFALGRWEVKHHAGGLPQGPFIVVANHLSMADPPLLSASIPRRIVFMGKEEAFHSPIMGPLIRGTATIPVRRGRPDRRALRLAEDVLRRGRVLGMFPEGTRSKTAQLQRGYRGAALIALRTGVPVVPVAITGTERIRGLRFLFARIQITVTIGEPFIPTVSDRRRTSRDLDVITEDMMRRIAALLPEDYRGVYSESAAGERSLLPKAG